MARLVRQTQRHRAGKKGSRAYGRNKVKCERYRREGRREAAKMRKAKRLARWLEKRRSHE